MSAPHGTPSQGPDRNAALRARVGTVLADRWTLDELLGIGGSAAVYSATHRAGGRVAIKIAHREQAESPHELERFRREPYLANRVGHPAVVRVFDDGTTPDGLPFFVMELLEGETVGASVHRGEPRTLLDVVDIVRTVLSALEAAHNVGVVHRDLKPSNLFRCTSGELKLLDFGIAQGVGLGELTLTGMTLGTPAFMAPEQALARRDLIGPQTDIFAVGASALVLLRGGRLREGNELMLASIEPLPSAEAIGLRGAPEVLQVFDRAVAFEVGARWPSARAMREALETAARAVPAHVLRGTLFGTEPPSTVRDPTEPVALAHHGPLRYGEPPSTVRDPTERRVADPPEEATLRDLVGALRRSEPLQEHTAPFLLERKVAGTPERAVEPGPETVPEPARRRGSATKRGH